MSAFANMLTAWWDENKTAVKNELEDRTGQRPTEANQVLARMVTTTANDVEIDYAMLVFNDEPVAFITVDWGEPLLKICYV